jgi:hypothetical protein
MKMQGLLRWTQLKQHLWPGTAHTTTKWEVHDEGIQNPLSNGLEKDKKKIGTGSSWQQTLRPKMAMI